MVIEKRNAYTQSKVAMSEDEREQARQSIHKDFRYDKNSGERKALELDEKTLDEKQSIVSDAYRATLSVLNDLGYFYTIDTKKRLLRGKITFMEGDYNKLIAMALMETSLNGIKLKYDELVIEHEKASREVVGFLSDRKLNEDFKLYMDEQEAVRQKEIEKSRLLG